MQTRFILAVAAIVGGTACALLAAELSGSDQTGATTQVAVDFLAIDADGQPITDLDPREVRIKLGRQSFQPRSLRLLRPVRDRLGASAPAFLNPDSQGIERRLLVVVDDDSIPQGGEQTSKAALQTLVRGLAASDEVGMFFVPRIRTGAGFTTDRAPVNQAIQRLTGRAPRQESAEDAACRTRQVLRDLGDLVALAQQAAGPVIVVFVSGGMPGGGGVQGPLGVSRACDIQVIEFQELGLRAARARTYFYVVQPETFSRIEGDQYPRAGLEHVAGATGGRLIQLSGRDSDMLNRVLSETSAPYVAVVDREANASSVLTLSVTTSRRGARIIVRPQLITSANPPSR